MRGFLVFAVLLAACGSDTFTNGDGGGSDGSSSSDSAAVDAGLDIRALGPVLWLDASRGTFESNGRVTVWADQSSNMNDAHAVMNLPSPKLDSNGANGKPCLHFEAMTGDPAKGTLLIVDDKPSIQLGTQSFYVTMVTRWNNDFMQPAPFSKGTLLYKKTLNGNGLVLDANNFASGTPTGGVTVLVGNSIFGSSASSLNDDKFRSITLVRDNNTVTLFVNGKMEGNVGGTMDVGGVNMPLMIGATGDAAAQDRLNGDIAEIMVFVNKLPPMLLIESYLKNKYAL